jgi:hypothetical protein
MNGKLIALVRAEHYVPEADAYQPSPTDPRVAVLRDDAGCVPLASTHFFVSAGTVEPGIVTVAASTSVAGASSYEFDLTPESARLLARELLEAAESVEHRGATAS